MLAVKQTETGYPSQKCVRSWAIPRRKCRMRNKFVELLAAELENREESPITSCEFPELM